MIKTQQMLHHCVPHSHYLFTFFYKCVGVTHLFTRTFFAGHSKYHRWCTLSFNRKFEDVNRLY